MIFFVSCLFCVVLYYFIQGALFLCCGCFCGGGFGVRACVCACSVLLLLYVRDVMDASRVGGLFSPFIQDALPFVLYMIAGLCHVYVICEVRMCLV